MSEEIRYRVCVKKSYKVFWMVFIISCFAATIGSISLSVGKCENVSDFMGVLLVIIFLGFCECIGVYSIRKRVEVYKGKIVYKNILSKKEYRLSDISKAVTQEESFDVDYGSGNASSSWDMVTTFYDISGKKIFRFGLAYDNVERLVKDVENTQKSIAKNRRSK